MQLLSVTDQSSAWTDFRLSRAAALKALPPVVDPVALRQIPGALDAISQTLSVMIRPPTDDSAAAPSAWPAATPAPTDGFTLELLEVSAQVVVGLLAGNVLLMLLLCIVALVMCTRSTRTRRVSASYVPVRYRDKMADDSESSVPIHSYGS